MNIDEIITSLLERRGVTAAEAVNFLNPSLADLANPSELPGVDTAADVILDAIVARRQIVVFGDYDCDGVSATAILVKALTALTYRGASSPAVGNSPAPIPFLPERLSEGYGMSDAAVARLLAEHPDVGLVVTVDNGINSVKQVADLKAKGLKVVVTDHHLPGEELPPADAVVDPKVAAPAHLADLCGAGVAFLLAQRLVSEAKRRGIYTGPNVGGPLLVLAGLATVTDIMPLLGQNRILVSEALKRFTTWAPMGLKELYARAARSGTDRLTSKDFGFMLGPRINAAGRLASGMAALELILAEDREIARELARIVDQHNVDRKTVEQNMTDEAMSKVVEGAPAQVIDLPEGHPGVAGIVAARVLERLGGTVPVCVLAGGHGSARSPAHINIRDAFVACAEHLTTYGGHAAAGGFGVKEGAVDAFRAALCAYCQQCVGGETPPISDNEPELWLEPRDITLDLAEELVRLEPFGEGNPEPIFGLKGMRFTDVRPLGAEGRHLSVQLPNRLRAVWWGRGDLVEALRAAGGAPHDMTFALIASDYGERHVELRLESID